MSMQGWFFSLPDAAAHTLESDPESVETLVFAEQAPLEVRRLDLRHLWHGVHFLLTGETVGGEAPLAHAVFAAREVGGDVGYGPARLLFAEEVRGVAAALAAVELEALRTRFDPDTLERAEIYPVEWHEDGAEELLAATAELTAFYRQAAGKGYAVLQCIV
jgi:hypothetical protein